MSKKVVADEVGSTITSGGTTRYFDKAGKELPYTTSMRSPKEVINFNQSLKNKFKTGATENPPEGLNPYLTNESGEKIENILKPESTGRDIAGNYLYNTHKYRTQDLSKLLQESKDYIKNNPNDKFIPEIQRKINELECTIISLSRVLDELSDEVNDLKFELKNITETTFKLT
jgi:paraquat-inducible protein B